MTTNLEARTLDSRLILITEHNIAKDSTRFPELYAHTSDRVRDAIQKGKASELPPIVTLQNPYDTLEKTIEAYQVFKKRVSRAGGKFYEKEDEVLAEVLRQNPLLCYNGNRRLEQFQKAGLPINAYVVTSQSEFEQILKEEKLDPNRFPTFATYEIAFLQLLDNVIYIRAEKLHWDNVLANFPKFTRRKKDTT